jgi:hypothetical protein
MGVGRGFLHDHCTSWQDQTANFYSGSDDCHQLPNDAPPFCTASCNSKSSQGCFSCVLLLTCDSELTSSCRR